MRNDYAGDYLFPFDRSPPDAVIAWLKALCLSSAAFVLADQENDAESERRMSEAEQYVLEAKMHASAASGPSPK